MYKVYYLFTAPSVLALGLDPQAGPMNTECSRRLFLYTISKTGPLLQGSIPLIIISLKTQPGRWCQP